MKLAVPSDGDLVVQQLESSKKIEIFDIKDRIIVAIRPHDIDCADVNALADFFVEEEVDALICGAIKEESCNILIDKGIAIYSGAEGTPDDAIYMLLNGDIRDEEGERQNLGEPLIKGKNAGKFVSVHYKGTLDDGTVFDSSYEREQPLDFACGYGFMIEGFEKAVIEMEVGDKVEIHLEPAQAYGDYNPAAVVTYPINSMPGLENLQVGQQVSSNSMGQTTIMTAIARDDETITFDANHALAGKALNFTIELLEVR